MNEELRIRMVNANRTRRMSLMELFDLAKIAGCLNEPIRLGWNEDPVPLNRIDCIQSKFRYWHKGKERRGTIRNVIHDRLIEMRPEAVNE